MMTEEHSNAAAVRGRGYGSCFNTAREVLVLKLCTTLFTRVFKQCPKMCTKYEHAYPLLAMNSVSQAGGQELFTEGSQVERTNGALGVHSLLIQCV